HLPLKKDHARLRVVFAAHCENEGEQLGGADSLQARWITVEQLRSLDLRGDEVRGLLEYMAAGGQVFPLTVLGREGTPYSPE
ncbi:MAG: NUDIX hydrolase, partial [Gemmatimonadota bacterium]